MADLTRGKRHAKRTMRARRPFAAARMVRGHLMLPIAALLLTACARPVASETSGAICRELRLALPTWSQEDTPETIASGARFVAVFDAVCG